MATTPHLKPQQPQPSALAMEPTADLAALAVALAAAGLPADDITRPGRSFFRFRAPGGAVVAHGGFEVYGPDALLRSIVVAAEMQGRGVGGSVVQRLLAELAARGVRTAWLITNDAAPFFAQHGFRVADRAEAPPAILGTAQAVEICATSAPLMVRTLPPRAAPS